MLDISTAYNKYKFLGNEFLTWIWFLIENDIDLSPYFESGEPVTLDIGNGIVLENNLKDKSTERISIKGDQAGLEEGTTALKKGAYVIQINLTCTIGDTEYKLTLKGESLNVTGLKTPVVSRSSDTDETEGFLLEKTHLYLKIFQVIDTLFLKYVQLRTQDDWKHAQLQEIRKWIDG